MTCNPNSPGPRPHRGPRPLGRKLFPHCHVRPETLEIFRAQVKEGETFGQMLDRLAERMKEAENGR